MNDEPFHYSREEQEVYKKPTNSSLLPPPLPPYRRHQLLPILGSCGHTGGRERGGKQVIDKYTGIFIKVMCTQPRSQLFIYYYYKMPGVNCEEINISLVVCPVILVVNFAERENRKSRPYGKSPLAMTCREI